MKLRLAANLTAICLIAMLFMMAGCRRETDDGLDEGAAAFNDTMQLEVATDPPQGGNTSPESVFDHSGALDDNGFFAGIRALDYVELFNYGAFPVPEHIHYVSDDEIENEIEKILTNFANERHVHDRLVVDGDTVNIDYVGSIDGEEFSGGNTFGSGQDVTIGVTQYIEGFLPQLIGKMPGDTVNVEVPFPDDYHAEDLAGKDALFVTVINYIIEYDEATLTDEFVRTNLEMYYGWTTVDEFRAGLRREMGKGLIEEYLNDYLANMVPVSSIPDLVLNHNINSMLDYFNYYANMYNMELDEFLNLEVGFDGVDELVAASYDDLLLDSAFFLVVQAIAEDAGFVVTDADLRNYFIQNVGTDDYSFYEEQYGLPYLKQLALHNIVINFIIENADLQ